MRIVFSIRFDPKNVRVLRFLRHLRQKFRRSEFLFGKQGSFEYSCNKNAVFSDFRCATLAELRDPKENSQRGK